MLDFFWLKMNLLNAFDSVVIFKNISSSLNSCYLEVFVSAPMYASDLVEELKLICPKVFPGLPCKVIFTLSLRSSSSLDSYL